MSSNKGQIDNYWNISYTIGTNKDKSRVKSVDCRDEGNDIEKVIVFEFNILIEY
jgi:hypothetical protein